MDMSLQDQNDIEMNDLRCNAKRSEADIQAKLFRQAIGRLIDNHPDLAEMLWLVSAEWHQRDLLQSRQI